VASEPLHETRFPSESGEYRAARDALLRAELELRRAEEAVAAQRRELPIGGEVPTDYVFDSTTGPVALSDLFGDKDTLVLYSYMFGPQMAQPCSSCTSILDALDGEAPHVTERVSLAVVAKSPLERIRRFAQERGWRHLRLLSSAGNSYNRDYHGEGPKGDQWPMLNVFVRSDGRVYHAYGTEMLFVEGDPGQDRRHVDPIWPLWNLFDLTPVGRGETWHPRVAY